MTDKIEAAESAPDAPVDAEMEALVSALEGVRFGAMPMPLGPQLDSANGVGDALASALQVVQTYIQPELMDYVTPDGVEVPMLLTSGSAAVLGPSAFDDWRSNPARREGTATFTRLESFIDHANRFSDDDSAIFAKDDMAAPAFYSVLDYHRADTVDEIGEYRFGNHRGMFQFPLSEEWKAWRANDGKVMTMREFSGFLEERIADIATAPDDPADDIERFIAVNGGYSLIADYARLIELSRGLRVNESSTVEESNTLSSGEGHLRFTVDHAATTVGAEGRTIKVPTMFFVAIPIFANGAAYRLPAQLRYRKGPQGLVFWFDAWRWDRAFNDAFGEAVEQVKLGTGLPVFFGTSE